MRIDELLTRGRALLPEFKGDDAQLRRYLEETVEDFHAFFAPELDLEQAVDLYMTFRSVYGEAVAHQFRFSLRGASKLSQALGRLVAVNNEGMASNNSHLLVLMHIGLLEFVELGRYVSFQDWLRGGLRRKTIAPPSSVDPNDFAGYLDDRVEEYLGQHGASRALQRALSEGLSEEEKSRLLSAYLFSPPFKLGGRPGEHRHLHCVDKVGNRRFYCLSCEAPSEMEVENQLPKLAKKLYEMRSAFCHRATGTVFAHPDVTPSSGGQSIYDVYFLSDGRIVEYEVSISNGALLSIFRSCLASRIGQLKDGSC